MGERQTEDLKVAGSIPAFGIFFLSIECLMIKYMRKLSFEISLYFFKEFFVNKIYNLNYTYNFILNSLLKSITKNFISFFKNDLKHNKSLWRNWLARSAVNRKVGGSNPPRDDFF